MALAPGTRLGPYEIVAPLGAGGMGEVYRARDTALDRDVALKVLPESFASDPDRLMRFTREAKTLASLNHPNIASIYGVEARALVMELVEGEDLSHRISQGPIPVADALPIARQIADALEAAHEAGIIHRDLKPANIKVREDGTVKVLDFGLAKALDSNVGRSFSSADPGAAKATPYVPLDSPTMTSPAMTQLGMILGTAAYMSPEQAKGKPVDRRADVWAFGVVLYEMLTGRRLFGRDDVSDTLAAVLTSEPDLALLPSGTPIQIRQLLARCLTKDKRQRLDSMAAARLDIEEALRSPHASATPMPANRGGFWTMAAGLTVAAFGLGWFAAQYSTAAAPSGSTASSIIAEIPAPSGVITAFHDGFALSPDGKTLAFVARNASGVQQLWTRRLDAAAARPLPGTEGAVYPFWSPTGAHIAFFSGTQLRRVPAGGGDAQGICNVFGRFPLGSWGPSDEILFASSLGGKDSRIFKVPAAGGTPTAIESLGVAYRPTWLADGRKFIYAGGSGDTWGVYLADGVGGTPTLITRLPNGAWPFAYASSGYLLMNRNDVLTAQRLDADTGTLTGPIATVSGQAGTPKGWMAVTSAADLIIGLVEQQGNSAGGAGQPMATLQWVTRQGAPDGTLTEAGRFYTMALSRDGRRTAANLGIDLWIFDEANRKTRLTSRVLSLAPVWQMDGRALVFQRGGGVWRQIVDRETPPEELADSRGMPTDWSADSRWILIGLDTGATRQRDIRLYDFHSRTSRDWLATEFNEQQGRFSTDGKWVAYTSDSSGQDEVYVRSFDGAGNPQAVSLAGGSHPRWLRDGRELYFLGPGDEMMAVTVTPATATIQIGEPRRLFTLPLNDVTRSFVSPYDVAPDGQRFLLNRPDRPDSLFFLQGLAALVNR